MLSSRLLISSLLYILLACPSIASVAEELEVLKPTVGPVLGRGPNQEVRIWMRGPVLQQQDEEKNYYGLVKIKRHEDNWHDAPKTFQLKVHFDVDGFKNPKDYVGYIDLPMVPGLYDYQAGYVSTTSQVLTDTNTFRWHDEVFTFNLRDPAKTQSTLVFGSCRYFAKILCWYPWLHTSDHIFGGIANKSLSIDVFAGLGDQIYGDYFNLFGQSKSYWDYMNLYEKAFTTTNLRRVLATIPTMFTLDDHEVTNNFGATYPAEQPDIYRAAMAAYMTYQHMVTPGFKNEPALNHEGYEFLIGNTPAFMLNTRSNRSIDPPRIMSQNEMQTLKIWLLHWDQPAQRSPFKVLMCSVPMFPIYANNPGQDDDKWMGYPAQMMELLSFINDRQIYGVIICSGDIHKSLYAQIQTPSGVPITTVIASPFFSPWGHDEGPNSELQPEMGIQQFVEGYPFISASRVYHTDAYAQLSFKANSRLEVKLLDREGEWLNSDDPAGHEYDLTLPHLK